MDGGRIVECGRPDQMKLKYAKDEIRALFEEGEELCVPKSAQGMEEIEKKMKEKKLLTLHSAEPNLEDIFLKLTGRNL